MTRYDRLLLILLHYAYFDGMHLTTRSLLCLHQTVFFVAVLLQDIAVFGAFRFFNLAKNSIYKIVVGRYLNYNLKKKIDFAGFAFIIDSFDKAML